MGALADFLTSDDKPIELRQGTVVSVQTGSITVLLGGATTAVASIRYLGSYVPATGDSVWLLRKATSFLAIGTTTLGRTASLFIPIGNWDAVLNAPTKVQNGGWATLSYSWNFVDTTVAAILAEVALPSNYLSGSLSLDIFYRGGGSGNFVVETEISSMTPGTPGDNTEAAFETSGVRATIASVNGLATATVLTGHTPTAGDLLKIAFARVGNDAADTSTNVLQFFGMRVNYTAKS